MRSSVLIFTLGAATALVLGTSLPGAAEDDVEGSAAVFVEQEIVVWVENPDADVTEAKLACKDETGKSAPDTEEVITSEDDERGRFMRYKVRGVSERDAKRAARRR